MLVLAILITFANGWYVVDILWPHVEGDDAAKRWLKGSLAPGVGLFVQSLFAYVSLVATDSVYFGAAGEILLLGLAGWDWLGRRRTSSTEAREKSNAPAGDQTLANLMLAIFALEASAELVFAYLRWQVAPLGHYDSIAIWTVRGMAMTADDSSWRTILSPWQFQADYPLLVPLSIARFFAWTGTGPLGSLAPLATALLFAIAILGVMAAGLSLVRDRFVGGFAGALLLGFPLFLCWTVALNADVPVMFFFLATFAVWSEIARGGPGRNRLLVLIGLLMAGAAWTKNDGIVFAAVACATMAAVLLIQTGVRATVRDLGFVLLGFALGAGPLVHFKVFLAPVNDFVEGWSQRSPLEQVFDLARWRLIAAYFMKVIGIVVPPWMAAAVLLVCFAHGVRWPRREEWCCPIAMVLLAAAYVAALLTTPHDLDWHLGSSVDRLVLQFVPLALWCVMLGVRPAMAPLSVWRGRAAWAAYAIMIWMALRTPQSLAEYPLPPNWRQFHERVAGYQISKLGIHLVGRPSVRYFDSTPRDSDYRHERLFAARFMLAPRVVEPDLDSDWTLAYHPRAEDAAAFAAAQRLVLIEDLGNGFRLYRR